jgi:hypothetical protein
VEVGQAVLALYLVDAELDLAECVVLILLEIGERDFEYPTLESVVGVLQTSGTIDEGLADAVRREMSERIPLQTSIRRNWRRGDLTLGPGRFLGP